MTDLATDYRAAYCGYRDDTISSGHERAYELAEAAYQHARDVLQRPEADAVLAATAAFAAATAILLTWPRSRGD